MNIDGKCPNCYIQAQLILGSIYLSQDSVYNGIINTLGCNGIANIGVYYLSNVYRGKLTIINCNIDNSGGCGIYSDILNTNLNQSSNTFNGNYGGNVCG